MNNQEIREKVIHQTITDAIHQLHNLEGHDRFARIVEIIEWLCNDYEELEIDWYKHLPNEVEK